MKVLVLRLRIRHHERVIRKLRARADERQEWIDRYGWHRLTFCGEPEMAAAEREAYLDGVRLHEKRLARLVS